MFRAASAALLSLVMVACNVHHDTVASTGDLRVSTRLQGQSAVAVSKVVVSIATTDPNYTVPPVTLVYANGAYTGTFLKLRASTNGGPRYTLTAKAFDAADAVVYEGQATNVAVTEDVMSTVTIVANSKAPPVDTEYVPVRITAVQANDTVRSGEALTFVVQTNAGATAPVSITWAASEGALSTPSQATTTWTAPETTTFKAVSVTVTVANGLGTPSSVTFDVGVTAKVDAPVSVDLNDPPVLTAISLSAPRVAPGGQTTLTVTASDQTHGTLTYAYAPGTCPGTFAASSASTATFTVSSGAPSVDCKLSVKVTDANGLYATGEATLAIDPLLPARIFTVSPTLPATLAGVTAVADDGAPGFLAGSIRSTGTPKAEIYLAPASLFGGQITLGDIARIGFSTKKAKNHVDEPSDWSVTLYTQPYDANSGWYGARIGTEPYFAKNLVEVAGEWNRWTTDGAENQLRFYESTAGATGATMGTYDDPAWSGFVTGTSLRKGSVGGVRYDTLPVLYVSVQTGSNATTLQSQLDGLRVELKDGRVAIVDFQP